MVGSVSNWWNGGGDDRGPSSVVAPSPQEVAPTRRAANNDPKTVQKKINLPNALIA